MCKTEYSTSTVSIITAVCVWATGMISGVARVLPGGWVAHLEGQTEEKDEEKLEKIIEIWGKMRKVELFPTQDCEAGYTLEYGALCIPRGIYSRLVFMIIW